MKHFQQYSKNSSPGSRRGTGSRRLLYRAFNGDFPLTPVEDTSALIDTPPWAGRNKVSYHRLEKDPLTRAPFKISTDLCSLLLSENGVGEVSDSRQYKNKRQGSFQAYYVECFRLQVLFGFLCPGLQRQSCGYRGCSSKLRDWGSTRICVSICTAPKSCHANTGCSWPRYNGLMLASEESRGVKSMEQAYLSENWL